MVYTFGKCAQLFQNGYVEAESCGNIYQFSHDETAPQSHYLFARLNYVEISAGLATIKRLRKAIICYFGCFWFFSKKFAGSLPVKSGKVGAARRVAPTKNQHEQYEKNKTRDPEPETRDPEPKK